ncbi:MAG: glycosyltransferase family 39 protein [Anaerolineales bacterium]|jgi:hypothetical protein
MKNKRLFNILSILIMLGLVLIALYNAILHNPQIGYDADDYAAYIESLSQGDLPVKGDNDEFFTPPLPFVIPAVIKTLLRAPIHPILKVAQFINILIAFASVWVAVRISDEITNSSPTSRILTILFMASLPVYYKTHAFVRAEPYLVLFILLYIHRLIQLEKDDVNIRLISIQSGILFGLIVLSRQWGILILPAVAIYAIILILKRPERRSELIRAFAVSGLIAFVLSGWFYLSLLNRYGSLTAFNRDPVERLSLRNKPASFYVGTGNGLLFTDPVRDSFDNQLLPILYSETWGDYWAYFVVYGVDTRSAKPVQGGLLALALGKPEADTWLKTNRFEIAPYLGRVNLFSTIPTSVSVVSFVLVLWALLRGRLFGEDLRASSQKLVLFISIILTTLLGYLWFLVQYPSTDGDTIKATYILQIFPFLALLIGFVGDKLGQKRPRVVAAVIAALILVWFHNLPAMLTN